MDFYRSVYEVHDLVMRPGRPGDSSAPAPASGNEMTTPSVTFENGYAPFSTDDTRSRTVYSTRPTAAELSAPPYDPRRVGNDGNMADYDPANPTNDGSVNVSGEDSPGTPPNSPVNPESRLDQAFFNAPAILENRRPGRPRGGRLSAVEQYYRTLVQHQHDLERGMTGLGVFAAFQDPAQPYGQESGEPGAQMGYQASQGLPGFSAIMAFNGRDPEPAGLSSLTLPPIRNAQPTFSNASTLADSFTSDQTAYAGSSVTDPNPLTSAFRRHPEPEIAAPPQMVHAPYRLNAFSNLGSSSQVTGLSQSGDQAATVNSGQPGHVVLPPPRYLQPTPFSTTEFNPIARSNPGSAFGNPSQAPSQLSQSSEVSHSSQTSKASEGSESSISPPDSASNFGDRPAQAEFQPTQPATSMNFQGQNQPPHLPPLYPMPLIHDLPASVTQRPTFQRILKMATDPKMLPENCTPEQARLLQQSQIHVASAKFNKVREANNKSAKRGRYKRMACTVAFADEVMRQKFELNQIREMKNELTQKLERVETMMPGLTTTDNVSQAGSQSNTYGQQLPSVQGQYNTQYNTATTSPFFGESPQSFLTSDYQVSDNSNALGTTIPSLTSLFGSPIESLQSGTFSPNQSGSFTSNQSGNFDSTQANLLEAALSGNFELTMPTVEVEGSSSNQHNYPDPTSPSINPSSNNYTDDVDAPGSPDPDYADLSLDRIHLREAQEMRVQLIDAVRGNKLHVLGFGCHEEINDICQRGRRIRQLIGLQDKDWDNWTPPAEGSGSGSGRGRKRAVSETFDMDDEDQDEEDAGQDKGPARKKGKGKAKA